MKAALVALAVVVLVAGAVALAVVCVCGWCHSQDDWDGDQ